MRAPALLRLSCVLVVASLTLVTFPPREIVPSAEPLLAAEAGATNSSGGSAVLPPCGGPGQPKCIPIAYISDNTHPAGTKGPEVTVNYTITVRNNGQNDGSGIFEVQCYGGPGNLNCASMNPSIFNLNPGQQQVVALSYTTGGLRTYKHKVKVIANGEWGGTPDSVIFTVKVVGGGIATHLNPAHGMPMFAGDSVKIVYSHPSGVNPTGQKVFIDGVDSTSRTTLSGNTRTGLLALAGGAHKLGSYVCATNGRCDSAFTDFALLGASSPSGIDDNLPLPQGSGGILGALPLPPDTLRGCPITTNHPEIRLVSPGSYIGQNSPATPVGTIFLASTNWSAYGIDRLTISTNNVDLVPSDNYSCANFTYLNWNQLDTNFWQVETESAFWDSYPYPDMLQLRADDRFRKPDRTAGAPVKGATPPAEMTVRGGLPGTKGSSARRPTDPGPLPGPSIVWPGGIVTTSYKVWLNGTLVVNNGVSNYSGVVVESAALVGITARLDLPHPLVNVHDLQQPSNNNGGWNEVIASVADSGGRRSYVRTRFVQPPLRTIGPITVTPQRDFGQLDQGECAAFSAFQCGGVMLTQSLPGFVTRDKPRGLNLVYRSASQAARTILPHQVDIGRIYAAPDSVKVYARVGAVAAGDTLRYYGLIKPSGAPEDLSLWENANEHRIVGTVLDSAASSASIRSVTSVVRGYYNVLGTREDTVRQEVVQIRLTDTSATRFGAGWQLAELSRLIFGQTYKGATAAIWLSGDGSYSLFTQVSGVWTSPAGETAKLLDSTVTAGLTARWVVSLANGASIGYTASGWHQWTADLLGNKTTYQYTGTRLTQITDPTGHRYEFFYNAAGRADSIRMNSASASSRIASFTYDAGRLKVVRIWRSPSQADSTVFQYATSPFGAYVTGVVDPRSGSASSDSIVTRFTYDSVYWTPKTAKLPPGNNGFASEATIRDPWRRAVPREGRGRGTQLAERMLYPNQARGTHFGFGNFGPFTDYTIDPFGGPTSVRIIAPEPQMGPGFQMLTFGGDMTRDITRDSLGRVTKIVAAKDSTAISDSVMYRYDVHNNLDRIIKSTAEYPVGSNSLDTISYVWDSASVGPAQRCRRLRSMTDAMGGITRTRYDSAGAGVRPCLPIQMIGLAADTTRFTYGALTVGNAAAVRPIKTVDPVGLADSVTYDATTWNSSVHVRLGDGATSRSFYGPFGLPDSLKDALNTPTHLRYDQSGRVIRSKTGTGVTAPATLTQYNASGLTERVSVMNAANIDEMIAADTQVTRYFFNRMGQMDSTLTPGSRTVEPKARRQWFKWDRSGNVSQEFTGGGAWIGRSSDWLGRVEWLIQSEVLPGYSIDGESYADPTTDSVYRFFGLKAGSTLSMGQTYRFVYDNKGRVSREITTQSTMPFNPDSSFVRRRGYSRVGALVADTTSFSDGMRVVRRYEYNRRGQRTVAATGLTLTAGGTLSGGSADTTRYYYDATTARLDSMLAKVTASDTIGRVRWQYDRAGRDTLRATRLGGGSCELKARTTYDAVGRASAESTFTEGGSCSGPGTWYSMAGPTYNFVDDLLKNGGKRPAASGGPGLAVAYADSFAYSTDGTRRLVHSRRVEAGTVSSTRLYDVFGNRVREYNFSGYSPTCAPDDTLHYSPGDNRLLHLEHRAEGPSCPNSHHYWTDRTGSRLVQTDTIANSYAGVNSISVMSYTAKQQLFFSLTKTAQALSYDYNWHWYDGSGTRVITQTKTRGGWDVWEAPTTSNGTRNYYVYDDNDVALTLVRQSTGAWWVRSRYMVGGLDQPLAGRFSQTGAFSTTNLALIADRQGSTLAAMQPNGSQETMASYYSRDPFGKLEGASGTGSNINTQTGFTGASTPNQTGGFVYMRNRWYDPQTGRFLTQDPIGLAGGINLYAYAGNNPVAFADPFGLCPPKNTNVHDCPNTPLGNTYRALSSGGPVGQSTISSIVNKGIGVHMTTGSRVSRAGGDPTLAVSIGNNVMLAQGLKPGAAASLLAHEVAHIESSETDQCKDEVAASNAELDVYDAQPAGNKENAQNERRSARRKADPKKFNESVEKAVKASNMLRKGVTGCGP